MSASLGLVIYSAVKPIFKIYVIIGMGFFLAKRNILTVTTCRDIADLVVTAAMPCLIFNNIVLYLSSSDIKNLGIIFFEGTLLFTVGALLALLTHYVTKSPKAWIGGLISVGLFPNISDLPIAYLQTMAKTGSLFTLEESGKGVAYVCIFLASQVFYQFSLGLFKLVKYDFRDQLEQREKDAEEKIGAAESSALSTGGALHDDEGAKMRKVESNRNSIARAHLRNRAEKDHKDESNADGNMQYNTEKPGSKAIAPEDPLATSRTSEDSGSIASGDFEAKSFIAESEQENEDTKTDHVKRSNSVPVKFRKLSVGDLDTTDLHLRRRRLLSFVLDNPLAKTGSRNAEMRSMLSEDMEDLIHEYSEFQRLRTHESLSQSAIEEESEDEHEGRSVHSGKLLVKSGSLKALKKTPLSVRIKNNLILTLKNFLAPNSVSLIVSLIIAMSPPLKALFVVSKFHMPTAPDDQPPLSFVIDIVSYVGAASVPLGLLILGATIARLKVNSMIPGFWKTAVMITACRLIIMPIFGVGLTTGLQKAGWFGDDRLIRFVSVLEYGLPNATALIYFTAFYTDPESPDHLQMDCLAICIIAQYSILFITLPFLVTFSLKVSIGF